MVLNHASIEAPSVATAAENMRDLAMGMAALVDGQCVARVLRSKEELYAIPVVSDKSVYDVLMEMRRRGSVEEFRFISRLVTKVPLIADLSATVIDQFRGSEATTLSAIDYEPLVLCAQVRAVLVSFPSSPLWDRDLLEIRFNELLSDGDLEETSEAIDNLARPAHVTAILERHRARTRLNISDAATLWASRKSAFPNLDFSPDVEQQLAGLQKGLIETVVSRLAEIEAAAAEWPVVGGGAPRWTCKVTPESTSVTNHPKLRELRRFRSVSGTRELFLWHARFGHSGRVHLRFDASEYSVEIGYIGLHLRL